MTLLEGGGAAEQGKQAEDSRIKRKRQLSEPESDQSPQSVLYVSISSS